MLYSLQYFIASGFYSGRLPVSGTAGSILAYSIWYLWLSKFSLTIQICVAMISFFIGIWVCNAVIARVRDVDPSEVVWDEFVGSWIACLVLPRDWFWLVISFVLFRFFDILKPFPVSWADEKVKGGLGVMLDDVFAGLYAAALVLLLLLLFN